MEITVDRSLRKWWVFVLRGVLFILAGVYMLASPKGSFLTLSFLFGLLILFAGIAELFHAYQDNRPGNRRWHLIIGLAEVILGMVLMNHLTASMDIMRIIVGLYILFRGLWMVFFAWISDRSWWLIAGGVLVVVFAGIVLFNPVVGAMTIIVWTALAFIMIGLLNLFLGLRIKPKF